MLVAGSLSHTHTHKMPYYVTVPYIIPARNGERHTPTLSQRVYQHTAALRLSFLGRVNHLLLKGQERKHTTASHTYKCWNTALKINK